MAIQSGLVSKRKEVYEQLLIVAWGDGPEDKYRYLFSLNFSNPFLEPIQWRERRDSLKMFPNFSTYTVVYIHPISEYINETYVLELTLDLVVLACDPGIQEVEAGESGVQGKLRYKVSSRPTCAIQGPCLPQKEKRGNTSIQRLGPHHNAPVLIKNKDTTGTNIIVNKHGDAKAMQKNPSFKRL